MSSPESSGASGGSRSLLRFRLVLGDCDVSRIPTVKAVWGDGVARIWLFRMVGRPGGGGGRIPTVKAVWGDGVARIWLFRMFGRPGGGGGRIPTVKTVRGDSVVRSWGSALSGGEARHSACRQDVS